MTITPAKSDEFEIQDIIDALRDRSYLNKDDRAEFAQMVLKLSSSKDPTARKVIRYLGDQMSSYQSEEKNQIGGSMPLTESVERLKARSVAFLKIEEVDPEIAAADQTVAEMDKAMEGEDEFSMELDENGLPIVDTEQPSGLEPVADAATGDAGAAPAAVPPKPATAERRELRTKFSLKAPVRYERVYKPRSAKV